MGPQPQAPRRDFDHEIPVVRERDRSREARPVTGSAKPAQAPDTADFGRAQKHDRSPVVSNARGSDDRGRDEMRDRVKPQREVPRDRVTAPTPVVQSVADSRGHDSGKMDLRRGRDIDDDSPRNGRRN